jgi:16S rRNA (adenine1518-N6/adenine1519-N6)-dimethyltransferase
VTLTRAQVLGLLSEHGLHPSRALGQNFVVDANTVRRIARLAEVGHGDHVLEIGAGLGSLTLALVETGAQVTALEIDRRLVPILRSVVEATDAVVVEGDALTINWSRLLSERAGDAEWVLVANLPYNIAVPVVMRVLEEAPTVRRLLVMVQREVGERLAANPGESAFGSVSVRRDYFARAEVVGRVPASVFVPKPKVESTLVRLIRRPEVAVDPSVVSAERLFALIRAGFAHRRQMLRRSLVGQVPLEVFAESGISPEARPETLGIAEWGRLAGCLERARR